MRGSYALSRRARATASAAVRTPSLASRRSSRSRTACRLRNSVRIAGQEADGQAPAVALADERRARRQREPPSDRPRQPTRMLGRPEMLGEPTFVASSTRSQVSTSAGTSAASAWSARPRNSASVQASTSDRPSPCAASTSVSASQGMATPVNIHLAVRRSGAAVLRRRHRRERAIRTRPGEEPDRRGRRDDGRGGTCSEDRRPPVTRPPRTPQRAPERSGRHAPARVGAAIVGGALRSLGHPLSFRADLERGDGRT
jgi:hypothetical protein